MIIFIFYIKIILELPSISGRVMVAMATEGLKGRPKA